MKDVYLAFGKIVFLLMIGFIVVVILNQIAALITRICKKHHKTKIRKHRVKISVYCNECAYRGKPSCPMTAEIYDDPDGYCSKGSRSWT